MMLPEDLVLLLMVTSGQCGAGGTCDHRAAVHLAAVSVKQCGRNRVCGNILSLGF
jgi:hypothetical protein